MILRTAGHPVRRPQPVVNQVVKFRYLETVHTPLELWVKKPPRRSRRLAIRRLDDQAPGSPGFPGSKVLNRLRLRASDGQYRVSNRCFPEILFGY